MRILISSVSLAVVLAACQDDTPYIEPRDEGAGGNGDLVTVSGRVIEGQECLLIETDEDTRYSLAGATNVTPQSWYEVSGRVVENSVCREGDVELTVSTSVEVAPPQDAPPPPGMTVTQDYVLGAWTHRGGDCARPDFDITENSAGGQVVETSLDGAPRTGYVRLGDEAAFIFDQPLREMPLEIRTPEGLAVLPPESGAVTLGGQTIEGDGVVFIKCAEVLPQEP